MSLKTRLGLYKNVFLADKTLDMLFKGAKTKQNDEDVVDNSLVSTFELFYRNDSDSSINTLQDVKRDVLYDCNMCKSTSIAVSKCWFCNNMLCQNCEKSCNKCNETFCSSCSIVL